MSDIQPGDLVVCVGDGFACDICITEGVQSEGGAKITPGNVLRVDDIVPEPCLGLVFARYPEIYYASCCFRKIDKSDEGFSLWMKSLRPLKQRVEA
jgi:hypothetical protein